MKGSCKIGSVYLSVRLDLRFLGIGSLILSKFWHAAKNLNEIMRDTAVYYRKHGSKLGVFGIYWNLVINFSWISSIMNFCKLVVMFLYKSHIWEKSGSWAFTQSAFSLEIQCTSLLSTNEVARFLNQSQEKLVKEPDVDTTRWKLKVSKIFGWAWSEMGVVLLVAEF